MKLRTLMLLRRLSRAQLRLKVMAGAAAVTLLALAGFGIAAVTIMRAYLLNQTDQNLSKALTLTRAQLPSLLTGYRGLTVSEGSVQAGRAADYVAAAEQASNVPPTLHPAQVDFQSILGEFDITFLTVKGEQVPLEVGANGPYASIALPANIDRFVGEPGPRTVESANGRAQVRVVDIPVSGGQLVAGAGLDQVSTTMDQVELIVTLGSIGVALLIGAGVFLVLRRGLRPIESMAAQAERITAGDLTSRVTPQGARSEVGRLGAALNGMLARIEAGLREREASQEQMRQFFADASHELRTPIASLRANAELYQQGALRDPDEVAEVMRRIALETRRMGCLVDDMLSLARLGQQPGRHSEEVDLSGLITASVERARAADPGRTWDVDVADDLAAGGDEELLRRAVDNLLLNVLVHTPERTSAAVRASADDDQVTVEVSDDGPGVPPDKLPHIFERFYRAGARASRPGSGLGLAIVAEVAAAHGGSAEATRIAPHGLKVTLTVPASSLDNPLYPERSLLKPIQN